MAVSRPRKLRQSEVNEEKESKGETRASSVKSGVSGITAATRKRQASAKYDPGISPRKSVSASQYGILKAKSRKVRP